jgi:ferric-dicitrate binding protein FerR (iron transport regulator)
MSLFRVGSVDVSLLRRISAAVLMTFLLVSTGSAQVTTRDVRLTSLGGSVELTSASPESYHVLNADEVRSFEPGDTATMDDDGRASLALEPGGSVQLYPSTSIGAETSDAASGVTLDLITGTAIISVGAGVDNRGGVQIRTDEALITSNAGTFLLYRDPIRQFTWLVTMEGVVTAASSAETALVPSGTQMWVSGIATPPQVKPAARWIIGDQTPTVDSLTQGELSDNVVLAATQTTPNTPTPGSAPGPIGIQLPTASLDQAVLTAGKATVWYWPKQLGPKDQDPVAPSSTRAVFAGDAVDVSADGEGQLSFADFLVIRLFRDTQLRLDAQCDPGAPPLICYWLDVGTTFNTITPGALAGRRVEVHTSGAVITAVGTQFLAYSDPASQSTWLVATDGTVHVSAAGGEVDVPAHSQTSISPGQPPAPPRPAVRANTAPQFPPVERLTQGSLSDSMILPTGTPVAIPPAATPASQSTPTPTPAQVGVTPTSPRIIASPTPCPPGKQPALDANGTIRCV